MNITDLNNIHPCTSCQLCAAICPKEAIDIKLNDEGFYRPILNNKLCIDCGLCVKVCYKYNTINKTPKSEFSKIEVWAASVKNDYILSETTSGGVADILAKELINQGYICCGVIYNYEKNIAENEIAQSLEETTKFRGSKYIQSYTYPCFKKLITKYSKQKFAVFGTPCHIFAINQLLTLKKRRDQAILIDFYCHGCPSLNLWKKYIKEKSKTTAELSNIKFRSKHRGWGNFCIEIQSKESKYISPITNDPFYTLFFSDYILNESCNTCVLRSTLQYSDIRVGDFWGKYDFNKKGVSIVTPITPSGKLVFNLIKDQLSIHKHEQDDVIPYQSWGKIYSPDEQLRKELLSNLANENIPLRNIIKQYYNHLSLKKKIKIAIKNAILHLPFPIAAFIKKIYH